MIRKAIVAGALVMGAASLTTAVHAQAFIGASIGQSDIDDEIAVALIDSGSVDGEDTGWKVYGGYMFSPYVGLEVGYADLGRASYSGIFDGDLVTGGKVDVGGFNVSFVGSVPLSERFSVFGKVGLFIWEVEASDTTGGVPFSDKADGTDISFGLGVNYNFTRELGVRAEWELFQVEDVEASLLSIGLVFKF